MNVDELMTRARAVERSELTPDDILLTDRVVVVTGGGGGIGLGVALGAAKFGADVAVLEVDPDRCAAAQAAIEATGRRALAVQCDVMDSDALRAAIRRVATEFGRLDALVNNAGGVRGGPFLTMPDASMRRHIDINLVSTLVATQEAARVMSEAGTGGAIVNVSSIEAMRAAPGFAVYAACKAGMVNFTRTMALELAEHRIRVNGIAPDHTITPGMRGNLRGPVDPASWSDTDESYHRVVPLGREGLVDECAAVAVWLCSAMSGYVTGVTVNVDGGTWASSGWLRDNDGGWTFSP